MRFRKLIPVLILPLLAGGCFSFSSAPDIKAWFISESEGVSHGMKRPAIFNVTRLGSITVSAPYEKSSITVLRANGTIAYDYYNVFPTAPSSMVRQPFKRLLSDDGRFGIVVGQTSIASADAAVEVTVTRLALDCSEKGSRTARVDVEINVIRMKGGKRSVVATSSGEESFSAQDGNYSDAFTSAFTRACKEALEKLSIPDENNQI